MQKTKSSSIMKSIICVLAFCFFVCLGVVCFSGCSDKSSSLNILKISVKENSLSFADVMFDLPSVQASTSDGSIVSLAHEDFWLKSQNNYLYLYQSKVRVSQNAPKSFQETCTLVYKNNTSITTEFVAKKLLIDITDINIKPARDTIFPTGTTSFDIQFTPTTTDFKDYTVSTDYSHALIDGNKITLSEDAVVGDKVIVTVTSEKGITNNVEIGVVPLYHIQTHQHLGIIRSKPNADYILDADIDLSSYQNWTPIPLLTGTFNGNGHTISNMNIDIPSAPVYRNLYAGLFDHNCGVISNLNINKFRVEFLTNHKGTATVFAGALCARNSGFIRNTKAIDSSVCIHRQFSDSGIICGVNFSEIISCQSLGCYINGNGDMGLISGSAMGPNSYIKDCIVQEFENKRPMLLHYGILVTKCSGGIAGYCYGARIERCTVRNIDFVLHGVASLESVQGYIVGGLQKSSSLIGGTQAGCTKRTMFDYNEFVKKGYNVGYFSVGWGVAGYTNSSNVYVE